MAGKKFIKSTLLLTASLAAVRVSGMAFRVFLAARMGEEGVGTYQMMLSVYAPCATVAAAGLGVAVTKLTGGRHVREKSAEGVVRFAFAWSAGVALMIAACLFLSAEGIAARLMGDASAAAGVRALSPGLPFVAVSAAAGGWFIAVGRVRALCVTQILEQAVRIGLTVWLMDGFPAAGRPFAACLGNSAAEAVSCIALVCWLWADARRFRRRAGAKDPTVSRDFLPVVLPIAASKGLTGGLHAAENLIIPARAALCYGDRQKAVAGFGALKGMALPLIMFPSSVLATISSLLLPELTTAFTLRRHDRIRDLTRRTLRISWALSVGVGGGFFRFARPLGEILYHSRAVGGMLSVLAVTVPFIYLDLIVDGLLKGVGEQVACLRYNLMDAAARIALALALLPRFGIDGFLAVMVVSNVGVSLLETRRLIKVTGAAPRPFPLLLPPAAAAAAYFVSRLVSGAGLAALLTGGALFAAVYGLCVLPLILKEK